MPDTLHEETLYTLRKRKSGAIAIAKWVDGSKQPVEIYTILNFHCDCFGSRRQPYCKHRKIQDEFHKLQERDGISPAGVFFDYDTGTFYCPEDGEGIPLTGAFNIADEVKYETAY